MSDWKNEVSIVIVNWNARDLLRDCILSIKQETSCAFEIIVVDNASTDASVEMVATEFSDVTLIVNHDNRGFAAANNQGIAAASGRYLLLLNPDTVVLDGAIDKMISWYDQHKDVGCAGCQVLETPTVIQQTCFADPNPFMLLLIETGIQKFIPPTPFLRSPEYRGWDRRTERDVDVVSGMFMLIPRQVLDDVGVLDEEFFIYAEEADLCRRIRRCGLRCVFTPIARILHLEGGGKSTKQMKPRMHVQLQKSMLIYTSKHNGLGALILVKTMYIVLKAIRWTFFVSIAMLTHDANMVARARLAGISLRYHVLGSEPH
jgi:GT2 family glycosyltransferase